MAESRNARFMRPQASCLLLAMVLQGLVLCSTTATHHEQHYSVNRLQLQKFSSQDAATFPTSLKSDVSPEVSRLGKEPSLLGAGVGCLRAEEGHNKHPKNRKPRSNCEISPSDRGNGIKATLTHDLSLCPRSPSSGSKSRITSSSVSNHSGEVEERLQYLKCAKQRSSDRVGHLLSRKFPAANGETKSYGLHTKHFAILDEYLDLPASEYKSFEDAVLSEARKSPEWGESYESDAWSHPGEYLMNVEIGTPPRKLKGVVDTGSDLTWFQCQRCRHCYAQDDPIFSPSSSSTYAEVTCDSEPCSHVPRSRCDMVTDGCDYLFTYGDDSYTFGTISTDTFRFKASDSSEPRSIPNMKFGCSRTSRGTFIHLRADGIIALGGGPLSFASQLGQHVSDRFSYCLVSRWHSSSVTSPIYFGDAALLSGSDVQYTPILENKRYKAYYYVQMVGISVGGHRLSIPQESFEIETSGTGGTIVDSGTTFTNLRSDVYDALLSAVNSSTQYPTTSTDSNFDLCFDVLARSDEADISGDDDVIEVFFPKVVFHLAGADLDLPLENYMLQVEPFVFCFLVDRSGEPLSVIGNVQQQNFRVLYDRQNARMGFQRHACHMHEAD